MDDLGTRCTMVIPPACNVAGGKGSGNDTSRNIRVDVPPIKSLVEDGHLDPVSIVTGFMPRRNVCGKWGYKYGGI